MYDRDEFETMLRATRAQKQKQTRIRRGFYKAWEVLMLLSVMCIMFGAAAADSPNMLAPVLVIVLGGLCIVAAHICRRISCVEE